MYSIGSAEDVGASSGCALADRRRLAQIWKAVMALDLVKRRAIRAAERLLPGADLKAVLADPFMMEVQLPPVVHIVLQVKVDVFSPKLAQS